MSDWTEERVEQLKKLWSQGWSASQIAKELGGTTRNAVIGKIHRLNLVARQNPKMTPPTSAKSKSAISSFSAITVKTPPVARSEYMPPSVAFSSLNRTPAPAAPAYESDYSKPVTPSPFRNASALSRQCQWPVGDPRSAGFHFCGCSPVEGMPYCLDHAKQAYQPSNKSKRMNLGSADLHASGAPDEREIVVRV